LSEHTVRWHMKQIPAKTGQRLQTDLARLVRMSPLGPAEAEATTLVALNGK